MINLSLKIDSNIFSDFFSKVEGEVESFVETVTLDAGSFWKTEAGRRLNRSREAYLEGLSISSGEITLSGSYAVAVEQGTGPYSLKPGFNASSKLKPAKGPKGGQFMVIPIEDRAGSAVSFKTYSTNTEVEWMHPGFGGVHLLETVLEELSDNILPGRVQELLERSIS